MDVKGKTKDNPKARMDIKEYCRRKELWLQELQNSKIVNPKASFSFTLDEKREIIEWVKNLRMPEGYGSNLGKWADMNEGELIGGDGDRHREHLGVSQTKQAKKKKSRRPIDHEDIVGSISSAAERISHDTHLFVVPFGTVDPRQYYPNYRRLVGASSTSQALPSRRYEDLPLQAIRRARPISVAPGQKDRLGRVMIDPDGSSWHPVKDAARALKDCVRRLYTQAYHSWSEIPNSILQAMFNNFKESRYNLVIGIVVNVPVGCCLMFLMNWVSIGTQTSLRQYQNKPKRQEVVLRVARCTSEVQRLLEQLHERWKKRGHTPIEPKVFKKTQVRKKENESDPDNDFHQYVAENLDSLVQLTPKLSTQIWKEKVVGGTHKGRVYGLGSRNDVRRLQSGLEGIGSSHHVEALDGVQIVDMSTQIAKLTAALAESERRREIEQESMSETVQQIKD
ncbi:hypothetical protein MTR67_034875 [Solanum verrucosum]|uniref:Uncharacterized protein n=1 Tax=Solanum verrucosum TaxID=315347 RepID=A0AAF0U967_SOLVR|nr:hypothetical protein MTR67_034875 [Solanum verrucosum]